MTTRQPIPRFCNGFTVFYDRDLQEIVVYDSTGELKAQTTLSLHGASKMTIRDVTAARDGTVAVAASAQVGQVRG